MQSEAADPLAPQLTPEHPDLDQLSRYQLLSMIGRCPYLASMPLEMSEVLVNMVKPESEQAQELAEKKPETETRSFVREAPKEEPAVTATKPTKLEHIEVQELADGATALELTHKQIKEIATETEPIIKSDPAEILQVMSRQTELEQSLRQVEGTLSETEVTNLELIPLVLEKPAAEHTPPESVEIIPSVHHIPEEYVMPSPVKTIETLASFEPIELSETAAEDTAEQTSESFADTITLHEILSAFIELDEDKPAMEVQLEVELETSDIEAETEAAKLEIAELTAELNDLLWEQSDNEPPGPLAIIPVLEYSEDAGPSVPEFAESTKTNELFAPFVQTMREQTIEIEATKPELIKAVSRLEAVLAEAEVDEEQFELTEQVVEDIITVLTHLGCEEPRKILIDYASTHSLPELFVELEKVLPELTKLIDYQQHLLTALARASTRKNRHLNVAEILTRLLFGTNLRVAVPAS